MQLLVLLCKLVSYPVDWLTCHLCWEKGACQFYKALFSDDFDKLTLRSNNTCQTSVDLPKTTSEMQHQQLFFSDVLKYYLCKLLDLVAEYRLSKNYVVHVWLFWGIYWKHQRFSLVINQMGDKSYVGVTWRVLQSLFDWISSFSLIVLRVNKLKLFFFLCCVIFCQYKKTVVKCRKLLFSSRKSGSSLNSPRLMTIFFCPYLTL